MRRGEAFVGEVVLAGRAERSGDDLTAGEAEVEASGLVVERLAHGVVEVEPELAAAAEEGDVRGVLVVGRAEHPGFAEVLGAGVGDAEAVDGEDGEAAAGHREGGGDAHAAGAEDHRVVDHSRM